MRSGPALLLVAAVAVAPAGLAGAASPDGEPTHPPKRHRVDVSGVTASTGSPAPGVIEDRGTITGRPFGSGSIVLLATFSEGQKMNGTFTIRISRGSASGTVATDYVVEGNEITFTGTGVLDSGTRRYRDIGGKRLEVYDHNTLDGQNGTLTLRGFARF